MYNILNYKDTDSSSLLEQDYKASLDGVIIYK